MKRKIIATLFAVTALLTFTAAAPADGCACGSNQDAHAGESCWYYSYAPSPHWVCWSPALGNHDH